MNAKTEFLQHVGDRNVICAWLEIEDAAYESHSIQLRAGYHDKAYDDFLKLLDFEYDDGYGLQHIEGTIWYADGTWSDRREYDGSEWWEHQTCPPIPAELKGGDE